MIEEARGRVDYDAYGVGPTVVLVPGSCSTGAAWRPIINQWDGRFRCVTTSLLGYERRTSEDPSITHEVEVIESVISRTGTRVHLVGHSFGGLIAVCVALRNRVPLASLVVAEAPAAELLREAGEHRHYRAFRDMTDAYFAAFHRRETDAIAAMIDFYGGAGTFASWPERVRAYAVETTAVNILDWASAFAFPLSPAMLATIEIPALVLWGGASHPAVQRANELLSHNMRTASHMTVAGAAHFMIATHAQGVARAIAGHLDCVEGMRSTMAVAATGTA